MDLKNITEIINATKKVKNYWTISALALVLMGVLFYFIIQKDIFTSLEQDGTLSLLSSIVDKIFYVVFAIIIFSFIYLTIKLINYMNIEKSIQVDGNSNIIIQSVSDSKIVIIYKGQKENINNDINSIIKFIENSENKDLLINIFKQYINKNTDNNLKITIVKMKSLELGNLIRNKFPATNIELFNRFGSYLMSCTSTDKYNFDYNTFEQKRTYNDKKNYLLSIFENTEEGISFLSQIINSFNQ